MHQIAGITVDQHRVQSRHHAVAHDRIAALFKIQIAADMVDHDEILADPLLQMGDRFMQSHPVETGLLRIGQKPLEILERTGHPGLAVPLDHGHIDQKIDPVDGIDHIQLHAGAVHTVPFLFLSVDEGHIIFLTQRPVSAVLIRFRRAVSHPGSLHDDDLPELLLL